MPRYPGDPSTPGRPSKPGVERLPLDKIETFAPIPVQPMSYRDGVELLKRLKGPVDRKSTRLNSSHRCISYAVFCLKKKNKTIEAKNISELLLTYLATQKPTAKEMLDVISPTLATTQRNKPQSEKSADA